MQFLKLIRIQNLLMLALMQLIFKYGFLDFQDIPQALDDLHYALLVLTTVSLAAAGYIINDVNDRATDAENRPDRVLVSGKVSESTAYNLYFVFSIIGVGLGFYLSNHIGRSSFALLFVVISATLYLYATNFKRTFLVGNLIVAALLAISVLIIAIFDLLPVVTTENRAAMSVYFRVILDYAVFAFVINLIREIVKDLEDVNGDYNQGMNTLPISLGVGRTAQIVFWVSLAPTAILLYYVNKYYMESGLYVATLYSLIFVIAPMIYFVVKMWSAGHKKEFSHLQHVLKLVILFGVLSILVVTLNVRYA